MKLVYIREGCLNDLKHNFNKNVLHYKEVDPWLDAYFKGHSWHLVSSVEIDSVDLICDSSSTHDLENSKRIYTALKHLSPAQASDERLWVALTHSTFWRYMRVRWPIDKRLSSADQLNDKGGTLSRYFVKGSKGLVRNGIARLWWFGYISYDEDRDDPFELTAVMLKQQDLAHDIVERNYSRSSTVSKGILAVLKELEIKGTPFYGRKNVRPLLEYINSIGGVTILDSLALSDVKQMVESKIKLLSALDR